MFAMNAKKSGPAGDAGPDEAMVGVGRSGAVMAAAATAMVGVTLVVVLPHIMPVAFDVVAVAAEVFLILGRVLAVPAKILLVLADVRLVFAQVAAILSDIGEVFAGLFLVAFLERLPEVAQVFLEIGAVLADVLAVVTEVLLVLSDILLVVGQVLPVLPDVSLVLAQIFAITLLSQGGEAGQEDRHQGCRHRGLHRSP